ncbi:Fatty-acid amide hydrolase 2-A like protein [Argiope bruennichi]|uniref:Fatty-acid amide hydrolase 2-A like protein n=1 Tax=Argiope bruennichi TaxID=94029 RepID=A0A8T0ENT8_ARGBR|nr:Fatty-acid amide hydrolase 2-A like protein [Argiope bruennichi]
MKSATTLAEEIREGKLKSEDVVEAYIDRILEVDPYINATVERCFEVALKEAREADSLVDSGKYTKEQLAETKPLLGIPVTIKCVLRVKALETDKLTTITGPRRRRELINHNGILCRNRHFEGNWEESRF